MTPRLYTLLLTAAMAAAPSAAPVAAQIVSGRVVDRETGESLALATVTLTRDSVRVSALTNEAGFFRMAMPDPQIYGPARFATVRAELLGFAGAESRVEVAGLEVVSVLLELERDPLPVDGVVVTASRVARKLRLVGFDRRRRYGLGTFLVEEDISRTHAPDLGSVLRRVPGLIVLPGSSPGSTRVLVRRAQLSLSQTPTECPPKIFLDGVVVGHPGTPSIDINALVHPSAVAALEVYRGGASVPGEYGGADAGCGVIVIWTH